MTRKDYVAIAAAIKAAQRPATSETEQSLREISLRLASIMQNDNSRFDRARFLKACGIQD